MRLNLRLTEQDKIKENFEKEVGIKFSDEEFSDVLVYCKRKIKTIGKSEEYIPVLLECELRNLYQAKAITDFTLKIMKNEEEMERVYGM